MNLYRVKYRSGVCFILLAYTCCLGCQNDDEYDSPSTIIGEWFYDNSTSNQTQLGTIEFSNDGKYKEVYVQVGLTTNDIISKEGLYLHRNPIEVVYTTKYDSRNILERLIIRNADSNTLELYNEATSSTKLLYRIVDTYSMSIGETKPFINSSDSKYDKFISCNDKVATVDENGNIKAVKRGNTFIRRLTDSGETIIRINVIDADNIIDGFEKYLFSPITKVIEDWGDNYQEAEGDVGNPSYIAYNVYDSFIRNLKFNFYSTRHVFSVTGSFQPNVNHEILIASFDKKYSQHTATDSFYMYRFYKDEHDIEIKIYKHNTNFEFIVYPNDFERYDDLITFNINNLPNIYNFDFSDNSGSYSIKFDDNEIYERMTIKYDVSTGEITDVDLRGKSSTTKEQISEWYSKHYYLDTSLSYYEWYYPSKSSLRSGFHVEVSKVLGAKKYAAKYTKK